MKWHSTSSNWYCVLTISINTFVINNSNCTKDNKQFIHSFIHAKTSKMDWFTLFWLETGPIYKWCPKTRQNIWFLDGQLLPFKNRTQKVWFSYGSRFWASSSFQTELSAIVVAQSLNVVLTSAGLLSLCTPRVYFILLRDDS